MIYFCYGMKYDISHILYVQNIQYSYIYEKKMKGVLFFSSFCHNIRAIANVSPFSINYLYY